MSSRSQRRRPERTYSSSSSGEDLTTYDTRLNNIGRGYVSNIPNTSTTRGPPVPENSNSGRWIYRGTERDRALDYVIHGDTRYITTSRPGDFHPNRNEPTAYFTTRERYAHQLARGRDGLVIQQRVPRDLITSSRAHEFDPEPSSDWRTVVLANREERLLGREPSNLRRVQRAAVITGPTAETSTESLIGRARRHPPESQAYQEAFRPVISSSSDSDSDIEVQRRRRTYTQQIAIRGEALERLAAEPRYARRPHRVRPQQR